MIYLDNAATTKPAPAALSALLNAAAEDYGNASSGHRLGRAARLNVENSRKAVAAALGAFSPNSLVFTSGGTEANNFALSAAANYNTKRVGKHIVTTAVEHDSVLKTLEQLSQSGFEISCVKPNSNGTLEAEKVAEFVRPDTALVSVMTVCNETGNVYDSSAIAQKCKAKNPKLLFHTDAVQAFCKLKFSLDGIDLASVSAHKIGGIKGTGAVYIKPGLQNSLKPILFGGSQEAGLRAGTENVPGIAAFGAACSVNSGQLANNSCAGLRDLLLSELPSIGAVVLGTPEAAHIVAFAIPGIPGEVLTNFLDSRGICVSKGSACKRGKRSHVWQALGLSNELADSAVRVSFCPYNTEADVSGLTEALREACESLCRK
ncbi:MAG: cysteine desulfurase [Oscillospiraceae bacterium]|jgi:cysteine desulfurase|nr:cysteine desulfurase [Oscillospiraceae bacterium]